MGLRYKADYRTLLWVALAAATVAVQFAWPSLAPYLFWLSCYFGLCCGVFAHNHNHCPTFKGKRQNRIFGMVLTAFYGYPTFAWVPTHNLNHHKFVNRAGDATITWRYSNKHNGFIAATYFFVSSYFQSTLIKEYLSRARREKPELFRQIITQYVVWIGLHVSLIALAIWLHGAKTGIFVWLLACAVPAVFSLWCIMLFNYEQHVHADPWSEHSHSRSWEGKATNFFLFNNGLHAAHHENPGTHWSMLQPAHDALRSKIDPRLVEGGMLWYFVRQYLVAPFVPSLGSVQVGHSGAESPVGDAVSIDTAFVELGDSGSNAKMVQHTS
jgi:beta-carotene hydroxylase